jgi:hypothetical protein
MIAETVAWIVVCAMFGLAVGHLHDWLWARWIVPAAMRRTIKP